jgi:hypothetical protein
MYHAWQLINSCKVNVPSNDLKFWICVKFKNGTENNKAIRVKRQILVRKTIIRTPLPETIYFKFYWKVHFGDIWEPVYTVAPFRVWNIANT